MEGGERRGEDGKDIVIFIIVFNFCLTFFFRSLNPPTAAFFFPLKTCWFIRVGGGCARGAVKGKGDNSGEIGLSHFFGHFGRRAGK